MKSSDDAYAHGRTSSHVWTAVRRKGERQRETERRRESRASFYPSVIADAFCEQEEKGVRCANGESKSVVCQDEERCLRWNFRKKTIRWPLDTVVGLWQMILSTSPLSPGKIEPRRRWHERIKSRTMKSPHQRMSTLQCMVLVHSLRVHYVFHGTRMRASNTRKFSNESLARTIAAVIIMEKFHDLQVNAVNWMLNFLCGHRPSDRKQAVLRVHKSHRRQGRGNALNINRRGK
jgi:hypothetical protein